MKQSALQREQKTKCGAAKAFCSATTDMDLAAKILGATNASPHNIISAAPAIDSGNDTSVFVTENIFGAHGKVFEATENIFDATDQRFDDAEKMFDATALIFSEAETIFQASYPIFFGSPKIFFFIPAIISFGSA